ncbi:MAG: hypothetical protein OXH09_17240 [Gammaproteobacteria bacterium]|nr:hypothetical protein [Gammaproteobacteria bacterium]
MLDSILNTTSRWPLARLHGGVRFVEPLLRATYRRKVVEDNLRQAFPDEDTAKLVRAFYSGFCQAWVEVVRSLEIDVAELGERVTFEGAEALDEGNALLLMAHHGNLIWAITALAERLEAPVAIVYKPPHTPAVREHLLAVAARFGLTLVPVKDMRREFLKRRHERPVWTLVADQRPGGRDCHTVDFCARIVWPRHSSGPFTTCPASDRIPAATIAASRRSRIRPMTEARSSNATSPNSRRTSIGRRRIGFGRTSDGGRSRLGERQSPLNSGSFPAR